MFAIKMSEDDNNKLKWKQYEYDTVQDLISRNIDKLSDDTANFWLDKLTTARTDLQEFKDYITNKYVVPQVDRENLSRTIWNANFNSCELEVNINE